MSDLTESHHEAATLPKKGPGYNMDRTPKCGLPEKKPGYARLAIYETYFILTALFISVTRFR